MTFFIFNTGRRRLRVTLMADIRALYVLCVKSVAVLSTGVILLAKVPWDIFVLC